MPTHVYEWRLINPFLHLNWKGTISSKPHQVPTPNAPDCELICQHSLKKHLANHHFLHSEMSKTNPRSLEKTNESRRYSRQVECILVVTFGPTPEIVE